ncbi:hypothetical protein AwDysgo_20230 [Bacteroidales bacterium]|nr:hypothetical protein AwDysgo_20230 [Bacteroidales bacterium]
MQTSDLPELDISIPHLDKIIHFGIYFVLSLLMYAELTRFFKRSVHRSSIFIMAWVIPLIYSGLVELIQEYFSATRTGDWLDFLANAAGASMGYIVCLQINKKII